MDNATLKKFKPILGSPLWERLEDDILFPALEEARRKLETVSDPKEFSRTQGEIRFIRKLLELKTNANYEDAE